MKRREFLSLTLGVAGGTAISSPLRAESLPKVIRIGTQKGGFFPAVRQEENFRLRPDALRRPPIGDHPGYDQKPSLLDGLPDE
jgi:hypothetical protein